MKTNKKLALLILFPCFVWAQPISSTNAKLDSITSRTPSRVVVVNDSLTVTGQIKGTNALWLDGTTGATPTSGAGTRLMWIPEKFSLRAGRVAGTEWDNANISNDSFVWGKNVGNKGVSNSTFGWSNTSDIIKLDSLFVIRNVHLAILNKNGATAALTGRGIIMANMPTQDSTGFYVGVERTQDSPNGGSNIIFEKNYGWSDSSVSNSRYFLFMLVDSANNLHLNYSAAGVTTPAPTIGNVSVDNGSFIMSRPSSTPGSFIEWKNAGTREWMLGTQASITGELRVRKSNQTVVSIWKDSDNSLTLGSTAGTGSNPFYSAAITAAAGTGTSTFSANNSLGALTLQQTNSTSQTVLNLYNSAAGTGDFISTLYRGSNAGGLKSYGRIRVGIDDSTNTSEDAIYTAQLMLAGTLTTALTITGAGNATLPGNITVNGTGTQTLGGSNARIQPVGITTQGDGIVSTPDTIVWTAQTASIAAQNFANTATGHLFKVTYYLRTATAGSGTTVLTTISWNDGAAKTFASVTCDLSVTTNAGYVSGSQIIYVASGTPTWATTVGAIGTSTYDIRIGLERVY